MFPPGFLEAPQAFDLYFGHPYSLSLYNLDIKRKLLEVEMGYIMNMMGKYLVDCRRYLFLQPFGAALMGSSLRKFENVH